MFVEMEMKWLSSFPKDVYAEPHNIGDEPISLAAYSYNQLGVHPQTLKVICFIEGDTVQFETDFATETILTPEHEDPITHVIIPESSVTVVKYTEITEIPSGYQQTCCNNFHYGNTLTKKAIVAWQYSYDEELGLHRERMDLGEETDEYLVYTTFVDTIPMDIV